MWPAIMVLTRGRTRLLVGIALLAVSPISRALLHVTEGPTQWKMYSVFTNIDSIMIGCLLAILQQLYSQQFERVVA